MNELVVCGFCDGPLNHNDRCKGCGSLWPKGKTRNFEVGESFVDYSYNRYQGLISRVYLLWTRVGANCFLGRKYVWRIIGRLLKPLIGGHADISWREPSSIIDVGCGKGAFLNELPDTWRRVGTDIVDYGVRGFEVKVCPFEQLELEQRFDIVRSWHSLEHSYQPKVFLTKLENLVEDGGCIVISTPNSESLSAYLFGCRWIPYRVETHYWIPAKRALEQRLVERGWNIRYSGTYSYFSAGGSFASMIGFGGGSMLGFILFTLVTLPLVLLEQLLGRGDSLVIYAQRKD